jgi:hypothetical protein
MVHPNYREQRLVVVSSDGKLVEGLRGEIIVRDV